MQRLWVILLSFNTLGAVTVLFEPLFPSDALTARDSSQMTGLRINLPLPDCSSQPTSCQETALLNQLDGFSIRVRAQVRFSAAVNTATLPDGVFFAPLGAHQAGDRIGIDEAVYDASTNTLYAKPVSPLDQASRYALVVTDSVHDAAGNPVGPDPAYLQCRAAHLPHLAAAGSAYCRELGSALRQIVPLAAPRRVVAASVFTTMSATAWLENARAAILAVPPAPMPLPSGSVRAADLTGITLHNQTGANPVRMTDLTFPFDPALFNGLDRLVIGSYRSPNFLRADQTIAPAASAEAVAVPSTTNEVFFNALLPSASKPAAGYPVVIFGHGFGDSRFGGPSAVAAALARAGFATIAINAVGHGYGQQSTVTFVDKTGASTTLTAGGRSLDLNGDGAIEGNEGCVVVTPIAYGARDCFRQTAVDLMQLARAIRQGLDLDGDGTPDLDGSRMYYAGQSLGAMYGSLFTAVEPAVRAAALNVGGATAAEIVRWSPSYQSLATDMLRLRTPSLLNQGATYKDDYALPGKPVKTLTVAGAIAIQNAFETVEWLSMSGDPLAYAPHIRLAPLAGNTAKPALIQFARGDQTVPNPANSLLIRAGGFEASAWLYRHEVARARDATLPANPHAFLMFFLGTAEGQIQLPDQTGQLISLSAQLQIADFFSAGGATISDPNNALLTLFVGRVFEHPASLPWDLGF